MGTPPIAALDRPAPDTPEPQAAAAPVAQPAKPASVLPDALSAPEPPPPGVDNFTPFAYGDFSWMNATTRNSPVLDTKFFTPEIRFDTNFMEDFNQPIDHTIVGATESFRSGEVQLEQISVGGDFHWQNVRGRILTMDGLFATSTPRNDASSATGSGNGNTGGVGQWDLHLLISMYRKPGAVITSTYNTGSTWMPEFLCLTSGCSVTITSITGPISRHMYPLTRPGSSMACASSISRQIS